LSAAARGPAAAAGAGGHRRALLASPQVPMSAMESDELLNDRYKAMEDRLKVRYPLSFRHAARRAPAPAARRARVAHVRNPLRHPQIVRKRLNHPLTLAEKARTAAAPPLLLPRRRRGHRRPRPAVLGTL
jgi:hypothetical protein